MARPRAGATRMAAGEAGRNHPAHRTGRRQRRRRASHGEDAAGSEARNDTDPRRQQAGRKPGALRRVSRAASERPTFPAAGYIDALHQSDTGIDAGAVRRLSGARAGVHRLQRVHGAGELAVQDDARPPGASESRPRFGRLQRSRTRRHVPRGTSQLPPRPAAPTRSA